MVTVEWPAKPETLSEFLEVLRQALVDTRAYEGCENVQTFLEESTGSVLSHVMKTMILPSSPLIVVFGSTLMQIIDLNLSFKASSLASITAISLMALASPQFVNYANKQYYRASSGRCGRHLNQKSN